MTMIDTEDRAQRRNALDQFAQAAPTDNGQMPQVMPMSGGVERVFGAQNVAVFRDEQRVLQKLAALGAAAGDDWFYRFPVRSKDGSKSFIEGASIKLANDLARIYGNCSVDVRVMDLGASWLIYARFMDYESGFEMTRPFQQNKGASKIGGKGDDADARRLDIALQIGVSKAIRNVVVNALQTYADFAFDAARNSLVDKIGKDIGKWQGQMAVRLKERGVELQRVEYVIGRTLKDWTAPDIARVIAMMKAIADGMATLDETFPTKDKQTIHDRETGEISEGEIGLAAENGGPAEVNGEADKGRTTEAGEAANSPAKPADVVSTTAPTSEATSTKPSEPSKDKPSSAQVDSGEKPAPGSDAFAKLLVDRSVAHRADKKKNPAPTEAEYVAHADAWREALDDADAGDARWKAEKDLRNGCNVTPEAREALQERLAEKQREIRAADKH